MTELTRFDGSCFYFLGAVRKLHIAFYFSLIILLIIDGSVIFSHVYYAYKL
jgi:hypothetical protein